MSMIKKVYLLFPQMAVSIHVNCGLINLLHCLHRQKNQTEIICRGIANHACYCFRMIGFAFQQPTKTKNTNVAILHPPLWLKFLYWSASSPSSPTCPAKSTNDLYFLIRPMTIQLGAYLGCWYISERCPFGAISEWIPLWCWRQKSWSWNWWKWKWWWWIW